MHKHFIPCEAHLRASSVHKSWTELYFWNVVMFNVVDISCSFCLWCHCEKKCKLFVVLSCACGTTKYGHVCKLCTVESKLLPNNNNCGLISRGFCGLQHFIYLELLFFYGSLKKEQIYHRQGENCWVFKVMYLLSIIFNPDLPDRATSSSAATRARITNFEGHLRPLY